MGTNFQQGIESREIALGKRTNAVKTPSYVFVLRVRHTPAMREAHAQMREVSSCADRAVQQTRGFDCENGSGTASAKPARKRMSFGPDLILILLAIAAVGLLGLGSALAADGEVISPNGVPKTGSFYRMQRQTPPLPFNPFPELPVYALDWSRSIFLIDDRFVDYEQLAKERQAQAEAEGAGEGGTENGPAYDGYPTHENEL